MPAPQEPQQQAPMEMTATDGVITQQPVGFILVLSQVVTQTSPIDIFFPSSQAAEPQPEFGNMRGGEEAGCEICCGLCACDEGCC